MDREHRTNISTDTPPRLGEAPPHAHRRIPASLLALMGLCLGWFVPVGWIAYGGSADTVMTMLLVSVFATVALGVPWLLARTSRGRVETTSAYRPRQWLRGQFETFTGRLPSREAIILILLPLGAAAVGITLMGIALGIAASGG
jgi:hypothetical protein